MSDLISILAAKPPDAPISLQNIQGITTGYQIGLSWLDGPYNGASSVIDYQVSYCEASSDTYSIFASGLLERSEIITGLTPGVTYKFKVQSRNIIDFSIESEPISIEAAQVPNKPTGLENVPENTTANQVGLQWQAPAFNGGSIIEDYQLWYDNASGSNLEVLETTLTSLEYIALGLNQGSTY